MAERTVRRAGRVLAMTRLAPFQILPPAELSRLARAGREQRFPDERSW